MHGFVRNGTAASGVEGHRVVLVCPLRGQGNAHLRIVSGKLAVLGLRRHGLIPAHPACQCKAVLRGIGNTVKHRVIPMHGFVRNGTAASGVKGHRIVLVCPLCGQGNALHRIVSGKLAVLGLRRHSLIPAHPAGECPAAPCGIGNTVKHRVIPIHGFVRDGAAAGGGKFHRVADAPESCANLGR